MEVGMRVKKWALMGILCGTMVLLAGCGKAQKAKTKQSIISIME